MSSALAWKPDWPEAKANLIRWWKADGLALSLYTPRQVPVEPVPSPPSPPDLETRWLDPSYRCSQAEYTMACHAYLAEYFPYFDAQIGPGSLGTFLGSQPVLATETVWYNPCIDDPDRYGAIRFETGNNRWWDLHLGLIEEGLRRAGGRYLVGMPDLIENLDTLAALRGSEQVLFDLVERPGWVKERLAEINQAFFSAFSLIYEKIKDEDGGNVFSAFRIWGPGKTAKLQCDFSAMISPRMFRSFVVPPLTEQCTWLDYAMYHLDGTNALQHLDALLEIEKLQAIEWTPQAGRPGGGSPEWYDLYRTIKAGGKAVQAVGVQADEVLPLLDAVGPQGMFVIIDEPVDPDDAEALLKAVVPYR